MSDSVGYARNSEIVCLSISVLNLEMDIAHHCSVNRSVRLSYPFPIGSFQFFPAWVLVLLTLAAATGTMPVRFYA